MNDRALILFTRLPIAGQTKTRLESCMTPEECSELHMNFLKDIEESVYSDDMDILIFHTPNGEQGLIRACMSREYAYYEQVGDNIWNRMYNSIRDTLSMGYSSAVLIGADIPIISYEHISRAFEGLSRKDITVTPTMDGGYCLIGMNKPYKEVFENIEDMGIDVFEATIKAAESKGLDVHIGEDLFDIDEAEDVVRLMRLNEDVARNTRDYLVSIGFGKGALRYIRALMTDDEIRTVILDVFNSIQADDFAGRFEDDCRDDMQFEGDASDVSSKEIATDDIYIEHLARGEYNNNYILKYRDKSMVMRLNYSSQMQLDDQLGYEFNALKHLAGSGRTPIPYYLYKGDEMEQFLLMSFIEGNHLDYMTDMSSACECLAAIHSLDCGHEGVIEPESPFRAILEECRDMFAHYRGWEKADRHIISGVDRIFKSAEEIVARQESCSSKSDIEESSHIEGSSYSEESSYSNKKCIINTELNSSNFLVHDGFCSLVDWEKPLYGYKEQDLGHFLAPTTTFWRTDVILSRDMVESFIYEYTSHYMRMKGTDCEEAVREAYSQILALTEDYIRITCLRGITWCAMAYYEYCEGLKEISSKEAFDKISEYVKTEFIDFIIDNFVEVKDEGKEC